MKPNLYGYGFSSRSGFSLAEIVVVMFFVTMAITLVAGLGQQVMNLAKRSTQTGAILELRTMMNSISRNSDSWIDKMRSSAAAQGLYAGCIPDPKLNIGTFNCPTLDPDLLTQDEELAKAAGSGFHISSSPIVNNSGEIIAGTKDNPVYLTSEGRLCSATDTSTCSLQSTGFFLRSNNKLNEDPGNVKFIIKVEKNPRHVATGTTPMKPQYMTVDIGQEWKNIDVAAGGTCPAGTIKVGYFTNGSASCLNPSDPCTAPNTFPIGISSTGATICKSLPQNCAATNGAVTLNSTGDDLVCATSSPCGANNLFLGYFGGSGEPMCSGANIKCASGQLQVGVDAEGNTMTAECATPPQTCLDANQKIAYDGEKFICQSASVAFSCGEDEYMNGMKSDGTPNCVSAQRNLASNNLTCAAGEVMYGLESDGRVKCRAEAAAVIPSKAILAFNLNVCPDGWQMADGSNGTPDLRGEFIRGLDKGRGIDAGRTLGSFQNATRTLLDWRDASSGAWGYSVTDFGLQHDNAEDITTNIVGNAGLINRDSSRNASVTGGRVRPRNIALLYCVKI